MRRKIFLGIVLFVFIAYGCGPKRMNPAVGNPVMDLKEANRLLAQKRCPEAIQAYQKFLAKYPKDAGAWNLIGLAYLCNLQIQEAMNSFQQALAIAPTFTDVHNNLGVAYMELKDYKKAKEEFMKCLQDSQYPVGAPYFNLAKLAYLQNSFEEARALAKKVVDLTPREPGPRLLYCMSIEQLGRLDESVTCYKQLLEISPDNVEACYHMGNVLLQKNKHCEAREYFNKVVDADPLGELGQKSIGALKNIRCN